jgi:predicted dithiol-disulfide oxidoreductase (DUF899 family)
MVRIEKDYVFDGPDGNATLDRSVAPVEYNFRSMPELEKHGFGWMAEGSSEQPGFSVFLRVGDDVFHTYSMYAQGAVPDFSS